jgi:hypothetical protein
MCLHVQKRASLLALIRDCSRLTPTAAGLTDLSNDDMQHTMIFVGFPLHLHARVLLLGRRFNLLLACQCASGGPPSQLVLPNLLLHRVDRHLGPRPLLYALVEVTTRQLLPLIALGVVLGKASTYLVQLSVMVAVMMPTCTR